MRKAGSVKAFSAFFMCPVSHTFPAYNGNVMPPSIRTPPWYTNHDACCSFFCADFCGGLRARAWGILAGMSRKSHLPVRSALNGVHWTPPPPSKAPQEKPAFFDRGAESFLWSAFLSGNSFFCARFCGVARAWKGPFPVAVFHHGTGKKSGFPGLCQPVAHACKPMPNPAIFRFKICGFPGVAATTWGFSAGRTYRNFPPPCGAN